MNPGRVKLIIAFGAARLFCPSQVTTTTRLGIIDGLGHGAAAASHAMRLCGSIWRESVSLQIVDRHCRAEMLGRHRCRIPGPGTGTGAKAKALDGLSTGAKAKALDGLWSISAEKKIED